MKIQIFVNIAEKRHSLIISEDAYVKNVIEEITAKYLHGSKFDQIEFSFENKTLDHESTQTLKELNIQQGSMLTMIGLVHGGMLESYAIFKDEYLTSLPGLFEVTTSRDKPDVITFDDGDLPKRAVMPCGHAISPGSMTLYCEAELKENRHEINCPSCRKKWPWYIIKHVSCFDEERWKEIEHKVSFLTLMKSPMCQQCPGCRMWLKRSEKTEVVNCWNCTKNNGKKFNFCWNCLDVTSVGTNECRRDCATKKESTQILKNCIMKTIGNEECPSVRSCPSCKILINHTGGCKHMTCKSCRCEFCFVCLKYANPPQPFEKNHHNIKCILSGCQDC